MLVAGGVSENVLCTSHLECGGGTCTKNNMGAKCDEGGHCTGAAECLLACPSQYLLTGLRTGRPHRVQVRTGGQVDTFFAPCVKSPLECDEKVYSGNLRPRIAASTSLAVAATFVADTVAA